MLHAKLTTLTVTTTMLCMWACRYNNYCNLSYSYKIYSVLFIPVQIIHSGWDLELIYCKVILNINQNVLFVQEQNAQASENPAH